MSPSFGADYTINPAVENLEQKIYALTNGEGVNVIFEAAGVPALLAQSTKILSPAGRLVAMTYGPEPIPIDFRAINAKELTVLGTRHQYQKFSETVEKLPSRLDRVNKLITHIFDASEFQKAFDVLQDKHSGAGKVLLRF